MTDSTEKNPTPVLLVVDDNPQILQLLGSMLGEDLEFDLCFATGGREALEVLEDVTPDLVLLDVNMPEMDGFAVCRAIRASAATTHLPVIFLTAQGDTDHVVQGFRAGGSDYVVKPFSTQELKARVRVHVELHRSRLELRRLNDELTRANEELRLLSNTDGLLRIANRRHLDETLAQEWQRATRGQQPLAFLIVDVDHFKRFNDTYGHLEGDECLKRVAAVLRRSVRRSADLVARYGGEEFAVVLPETTPSSAGRVAGLIHRTLAEEAIPHSESPLSGLVTVSIGVAGAVPSFGTSPELLLQEADRALYEAKAAGRNRTCGLPIDD